MPDLWSPGDTWLVTALSLLFLVVMFAIMGAFEFGMKIYNRRRK